MNGYGQYETDRRVLDGILTLLLALADLAEAAAGRSELVQRLVFLVLLRAESVARDFLSGREWDHLDVIADDTDRPAALLRLAWNLRTLAGLLAALLDSGFRLAGQVPPDAILDCVSSAIAYAIVISAMPAPDTS